MPAPGRSLSRFFHRLGLVCVRTSHPAAHYLQHQPASAFETVLLRLFPDLRGLRFIQIGANDGRRADPICTFIDTHAWGGLMIEPLAANFADLRRHRGDSSPRIRLRQAAVDLSSGRRQVYDLAPSATDGLPDSSIIAEEIDTITWDQVWQEFGARPCDLLVLDTEGYDLTLLRAASLASNRPRVIHFEHACATPEDRHAFYRKLTDLGYEIATDGPDTTAWLQP